MEVLDVLHTKRFQSNQKMVCSNMYSVRPLPGGRPHSREMRQRWTLINNAGVSLITSVIKNVTRNYNKRFFDCFSLS